MEELKIFFPLRNTLRNFFNALIYIFTFSNKTILTSKYNNTKRKIKCNLIVTKNKDEIAI